MANLVKRINFVGKKGDTLHVPDLSELGTTAKSGGTDVVYETFTETKFDLSIDQHFYSAFKVEDIAEVQSFADLRAEYTRSAGYAMARKIDTTLHALSTSMTRVIGGDGSTAWDGTANTDTGNGTDLTELGIRNALETLDLAEVDQEDRYLVINPRQLNVLRGIARLTEMQTVGSSSGLTGKMFDMPVFGVKVLVTTQTATLAADDTTTNYDVNLLFQKEAMILAMQKEVRTQGQYIVKALGTEVVVDAIWGIGLYRSDHALGLITPR